MSQDRIRGRLVREVVDDSDGRSVDSDGGWRWLAMPRHTQPEPDVQALLNQIRITLPSQPPLRIKASQVTPP